MNNTTYSNIEECAEVNNLQQITTTQGMNGYPQGLNSNHLIGFDSFKDAEEFVEENGGEITLYKIRDGHHFYSNQGRACEPLTSDNYIDDLGDNYRLMNTEDEIDEQFEEIQAQILSDKQDAIDSVDMSMDNAQDEIDEINQAFDSVLESLEKYTDELKSELKSMKTEQSLVCENQYFDGACDNKYYMYCFVDVVDNEMMSYHEDVHTYVIGVDMSDVVFEDELLD